jgi:hypothetical protein
MGLWKGAKGVLLRCQIKIIIPEDTKSVFFSCCTKIKEKIVVEEMKVRYIGIERWSNVHGGGIQEIVVLGAGQQLKYLVGGPKYGAMDPTKEPLLITI